MLGALFTANSGTTTTAGIGFELSCIASKISEASTEMRLSTHETAYGKSGSTVNQKTKQIYNSKLFKISLTSNHRSQKKGGDEVTTMGVGF